MANVSSSREKNYRVFDYAHDTAAYGHHFPVMDKCRNPRTHLDPKMEIDREIITITRELFPKLSQSTQLSGAKLTLFQRIVLFISKKLFTLVYTDKAAFMTAKLAHLYARQKIGDGLESRFNAVWETTNYQPIDGTVGLQYFYHQLHSGFKSRLSELTPLEALETDDTTIFAGVLENQYRRELIGLIDVAFKGPEKEQILERILGAMRRNNPQLTLIESAPVIRNFIRDFILEFNRVHYALKKECHKQLGFDAGNKLVNACIETIMGSDAFAPVPEQFVAACHAYVQRVQSRPVFDKLCPHLATDFTNTEKEIMIAQFLATDPSRGTFKVLSDRINPLSQEHNRILSLMKTCDTIYLQLRALNATKDTPDGLETPKQLIMRFVSTPDFMSNDHIKFHRNCAAEIRLLTRPVLDDFSSPLGAYSEPGGKVPTAIQKGVHDVLVAQFDANAKKMPFLYNSAKIREGLLPAVPKAVALVETEIASVTSDIEEQGKLLLFIQTRLSEIEDEWLICERELHKFLDLQAEVKLAKPEPAQKPKKSSKKAPAAARNYNADIEYLQEKRQQLFIEQGGLDDLIAKKTQVMADWKATNGELLKLKKTLEVMGTGAQIPVERTVASTPKEEVTISSTHAKSSPRLQKHQQDIPLMPESPTPGGPLDN